MVPNVGTKGCHGKELPVPRPCDLETYGSQPGNHRLPLQGIAGSQKLEFMFSKLSNYSLKGTVGSQSLKLMVPSQKKHTLPVEGSVDSKKLKLMVLNVVLFCLLSR